MLFPFFIQAQTLDPVSYIISEAPEQVKAGEVFTVTVKADIEGKWHLYSINNDPDAGPYPTQFSSANDKLVIAGNIEESEATIVLDPNFNVELGWHSGEAVFSVPMAFGKDVFGSNMIDLEVLYQVCDDKSCLPPKTKSITHPIEVTDVAEEPYSIESSGSGK